VIVDNLQSGKDAAKRELTENTKAKLTHLPSGSVNFNPIGEVHGTNAQRRKPAPS
jgi:hypothetical protein